MSIKILYLFDNDDVFKILFIIIQDKVLEVVVKKIYILLNIVNDSEFLDSGINVRLRLVSYIDILYKIEWLIFL